MWGPNGNTRSFVLVFAISMAVTSIPVISRIMHDLGILDTRFARVVLGVAVLEDLVLYVVLAIAIGYAGAQAGALFGLPDALGIAGGSNTDIGYHIARHGRLPDLSLLAGPAAYRWIGGLRVNVIQRASPIGHQLTFMFLLTIAALGLGIGPSSARSSPASSSARPSRSRPRPPSRSRASPSPSSSRSTSR